MTKLLVAFVFLALNFYTYNFLASQAVIPPRATFDAFPLDIGEWSCSRRERMEPEVEKNLGVTDYLICTYRRVDSSQLASVYIGYHATQIREEGGGAGENSIHPPALPLVTAARVVAENPRSAIESMVASISCRRRTSLDAVRPGLTAKSEFRLISSSHKAVLPARGPRRAARPGLWAGCAKPGALGRGCYGR